MSLELRPNCECCDRDLPPDSREATICTFGLDMLEPAHLHLKRQTLHWPHGRSRGFKPLGIKAVERAGALNAVEFRPRESPENSC